MRAPKSGHDGVAEAVTDDSSSTRLVEAFKALDILAHLPHTDGPVGGDTEPSGEGARRPRPALWLGVDTPFRIGHD